MKFLAVTISRKLFFIFLINSIITITISGMVIFSFDTPYYLLGPSKYMVNPIGSFIGIIILLITIFSQRRFFSSTGRFLASTVKASFKEEMP